MNAVLAGVGPVFLLIALGWTLRVSGFLPLERWAPIERLAFFVLYPGFLVPTIWAADLSGGSAGVASLSAIITVVAVGATAVVAKPLMRLPDASFTSVFQGMVRWNAFVFLPVVASVFGPKGLALAAVVIGALVPVVNVMCVLVLARWGEGQGQTHATAIMKAMARNPILMACIVGVALNLSGVPPIPGLSPALKLLGDSALPLGLLIAGSGLSFRYASTRRWTIAAVTTIKLAVIPLIMVGVCRLLGGDALAQGVVLACGSAPGAAASYVLARQMGGDAPLVAGITAATTAGAAITIPLLFTLFHFG